MNNKKKTLIGIIFAIILIFVLRISYAYFMKSFSQENKSLVKSGCFNIKLIENSDAINIDNLYPITDEEAKNLKPFTFTIKNTCNYISYYQVNLETFDLSTINNKFIKVSLKDKVDILSDYQEVTPTLADAISSNTLITGYLFPKKEVTYDLRIWLDYNTTLSDIKNDNTDMWQGKITVISTYKTREEALATCKDLGGDLLVDGECKKYFVKLNQLFNVNNIAYTTFTYTINNASTNNFSLSKNTTATSYRFGFTNDYTPSNIYYFSFNSSGNSQFTSAFLKSEEFYPEKATKYSWKNSDNYYFYTIEKDFNSYFLVPNRSEWSMWYYENVYYDITFSNFSCINLTLMFGDGYEPDKEWCDKNLTNYFEYNKEGTLISIKDIGYDKPTAYYETISLEK